MLAGAAKTDITPTSPVYMDGMIRAHRSLGVHDRLYARCLVLANESSAQVFAIISVDVCALDEQTCAAARQRISTQAGIATQNVIVAATHTHSGPATYGFFNPREDEYNGWLVEQLAALAKDAVHSMRPAMLGCGSGREESISHYRRLLSDDGRVIMNWEAIEPQRLRGPLGVADPEVGVLRVTPINEPAATIAILFNHSGHPDVMSGDNYLLSPDYPGCAERLLEQEFGGIAIFVNGAQGSVDVDGLRDRDWRGVERLGSALARAVAGVARQIALSSAGCIRGRSQVYTVPGRQITTEEWLWAQQVLKRTGGALMPLPDGVGDDYLAVLYKSLREEQGRDLAVEQVCLAIGDCAFLSFPGELYTEIGMAIKAASPFRHTYIIGLANGYIGYVPTRKAISEGGYAEDTRRVDAASEQIVFERSLALLQSVYSEVHMEGGNHE
jgi:hypothetical protein